MKTKKYQIWDTEYDTETSMFEIPNDQADFLSRDTNGNRMILKKEFEAISIAQARRVYNQYIKRQK